MNSIGIDMDVQIVKDLAGTIDLDGDGDISFQVRFTTCVCVFSLWLLSPMVTC